MELWVDKYAPKTISDYVFQDEEVKKRVESYVKRGSTDNLLVYGPPGVGKTSLYYVLMNELHVDPSNCIKLNGVRNGIDDLRELITSFIMSGGWSGGLKYVCLDEADGLSPQAQGTLKSDTEEFSDSVRWFLTSNAEHRIIKPLRDRCVSIPIQQPDRDKYLERMINILLAENINIDDSHMDALQTIVKQHYPSLRGAIRALQDYTINGTFEPPKSKAVNVELFLKVYSLFAKGKIRDARELLCKSITKDEIEGVYVWLYKNIELFKDKDQSIIMINEGLKAHQYVADGEINLSATLTQLALINQ